MRKHCPLGRRDIGGSIRPKSAAPHHVRQRGRPEGKMSGASPDVMSGVTTEVPLMERGSMTVTTTKMTVGPHTTTGGPPVVQTGIADDSQALLIER